MTDLVARFDVDRAGGGFSLRVDLRFPPGITCVMGPSGAGKSTLMAAIAGLVVPSQGRVALGDTVWFESAQGLSVPIQQRRLGFLFQSLALFPHRTAIGNVEYGMPRSLPRAERHARAHALLAKLGVDHLAHRRPRTFSGGEKALHDAKGPLLALWSR
ncbi:MAG TPA: ATP-binding cassette domain-containing protein, partial [Kofleriaceae bacterium]|nr:ATP-binding cassette domain-containing protein [Kofleriaceae bacterium]